MDVERAAGGDGVVAGVGRDTHASTQTRPRRVDCYLCIAERVFIHASRWKRSTYRISVSNYFDIIKKIQNNIYKKYYLENITSL